jgi:iron(III) transport system substrate-binding protein
MRKDEAMMPMIRSHHQSRHLTTLALLSTLVVFACGGSGSNSPSSATSVEVDASQSLIAAAQQEGSLVLYGSSPDPQLKAIADGFKSRYGITVNYTRFPSGPMNDRVNTELRAGQLRADVLIHADPIMLETWSNQNVFAKLPSVKSYPINNPFHTAIKIDTQGVMYNTDQVKDGDIKTWNDLLKPQFKGRIGLVGPRVGFGIAIGYYALMNDPKYGQAWYNKLAAQKPVLTSLTPDGISSHIAAGEYSISFIALESTVPNLKANSPSAPVAFKYLDISGVVPTEIALTVKPTRPNAAELFVRWVMSREGQIAYNGNNRSSSPLGELPGTATPPAKSVQRVEDPAAVNKAWPGLQTMFDQLYGAK